MKMQIIRPTIWFDFLVSFIANIEPIYKETPRAPKWFKRLAVITFPFSMGIVLALCAVSLVFAICELMIRGYISWTKEMWK